MAMVSIHSLWKDYFDSGESGKEKRMAYLCNRRILYQRERTSQCTSIEPFNVLYQTAERWDYEYYRQISKMVQI